MSDQVTTALRCPFCGETGVAIWDAVSTKQRELQSLYGRFHGERGRTVDDQLLIICNTCDEILTD